MVKQTLVEQAAQTLIEIIKQKGYSAGDKLPTEAELSVMLDVGRNTIREALRLLMSRNIVTIRQGSGSFISAKNGVADDPLGFLMIENQMKLTEDLLQVRVMLEPPIAALAAQNATSVEIERLYEILKDLEELMKNKADYAEKDSQFHTQIANCSHNLVMTTLLPVIAKGIQVFAGAIQETEYEQTLLSHRRIFAAIHDKKPIEAQQAMYFHLMYNENRYKEETHKKTNS